MKKTYIALSLVFIGMMLIESYSFPSAGKLSASLKTAPLSYAGQGVNIQHQIQTTQPTDLYHTYSEMTALLQSLAATYPDIMSVSSIGETYEGRNLWLVKISDNVNQDEQEPGVLFMGAHHGNEKSSYEVCLYFIQYMVEHYDNASTPEVRTSINATQIYLIPMVNPDGVERDMRKDREPNHGSFGFRRQVTSYGVDLNRNYGQHWLYLFLFPYIFSGSTSWVDSSDVYRGPWPFSANETKAVRQFVITHNISLSISYHSYGELVLYPWGYTTRPPKDKSLFVSIGSNISTFDKYQVEQSIRLYPTLGDSCDWMYATQRIFAFTIELGTSYAPSDPEVLQNLCVNHTIVNLYICQRAQTL